MADLRETIAAFREKYPLIGEWGIMLKKQDLLALIAEMKRKPPRFVSSNDDIAVWDEFADLLTEALSPQGGKK